MKCKVPLLVAFLPFVLSQPAFSQGIMEAGSIRGLSAGLGAGLAASVGNGRVVRRSYEAVLAAQQAAAANTAAINKYLAMGNTFEKKKQWNYAEVSLEYVLRLIAKRDGPGSQNAQPVLQKLANVDRAQHKTDQAINYQKTALALAEGAKKPVPKVIVEAGKGLGTLFMDKSDYRSAEPVLRKAAQVAQFDPSVPSDMRAETFSVYGRVLRELHRDADAQTIENYVAAGAPVTAVAPTSISPANNPVGAASAPPAASVASTAAATAKSSDEPALLPMSELSAPAEIESIPMPELPRISADTSAADAPPPPEPPAPIGTSAGTVGSSAVGAAPALPAVETAQSSVAPNAVPSAVDSQTTAPPATASAQK